MGAVTEWATGITLPRQHVLAIRGDGCSAMHVALMQFVGNVAAPSEMLRKGLSTNWEVVHADVLLRARMKEMTTGLSGYSHGKGGPPGCTCPTSRGRETSVRPPSSRSGRQTRAGDSGTQCQLLTARRQDLVARAVRRVSMINMLLNAVAAEPRMAMREGAARRRYMAECPSAALAASRGEQAWTVGGMLAYPLGGRGTSMLQFVSPLTSTPSALPRSCVRAGTMP